jgi:hypothetical protein
VVVVEDAKFGRLFVGEILCVCVCVCARVRGFFIVWEGVFFVLFAGEKVQWMT